MTFRGGLNHEPGWRDDGGCEPDGGPGPRPLTLEWRKRVAAWLREVGPSLPEVPCWHPGVERDPAARPSLAEADFPA